MLDQDLKTWLWKDEPSSPTASSTIGIDDDWLQIDSQNANDSTHTEPLLYEENASRAQVATKLLKELDEWIKEEPFSDWLEEKIDLPIFEDLSSPECGSSQTAALELKPQDATQSLLQEFETVLGDVEACHLAGNSALSLTPPQSPPTKNYETPTSARILAPLQAVFVSGKSFISEPITAFEISPIIDNELPVQWGAENVSLEPLGDVDTELAVVDELVRSRTKDIEPSSPSASSEADSASSDDDPEWRPDLDSVEEPSPKSVPSKATSSGRAATKSGRAKPYARPLVEEKKVRKKEQNKNAATRYRQKKKAEIEVILGEEQELTELNEKLQNQFNDLQREIRYLKGLMRDLFKAKGLIK